MQAAHGAPSRGHLSSHRHDLGPAFTVSFSVFPALNVGDVDADIATASPARGLRPVRAGRLLVPKIPNRDQLVLDERLVRLRPSFVRRRQVFQDRPQHSEFWAIGQGVRPTRRKPAGSRLRMARDVADGVGIDVFRRIGQRRKPVVHGTELSDLRRERSVPPVDPCRLQRGGQPNCQTAFNIDPRSACKIDPPERHGGGCPGSQ